VVLCIQRRVKPWWAGTRIAVKKQWHRPELDTVDTVLAGCTKNCKVSALGLESGEC